ncbi:MAG: hypothetical protein HQL60_04220 [Magnetococcales bacterium]|nr:hypothetical protein [Magnetococcales bacterium]
MMRLREVALYRIILMAVVGVLCLMDNMPVWAMGAAVPQLQPAQDKPCVRDPAWMRRNHPEFLRQKRDLTVREGVRVRNESLARCATCHQDRAQFCDRCHQYAGVDPNCFTCHNYVHTP